MKVNLIYFKPNGKFYSEGSFETEERHLFEIWNEVDVLVRTKTLPGLTEGAGGYIVLIDVPEHPHNHPHLCNTGRAWVV